MQRKLLPSVVLFLLVSRVGVLLAEDPTQALQASWKNWQKFDSSKLKQTEFATSSFIRIRKDEAQAEPVALQTSIMRFAAPSKSGATVDLIGAVHIGEGSYYEQLNQQFEKYDVLLYELVAPEGTKIPFGEKRKSPGNPVSFLQNGMKSLLRMESQLERVNYTCKNMVRADMTPAQIAEKMKERGDSVMTIALSTLADVMRQQNKAAKAKPPASKEARPPVQQNVFKLLNNPVAMKRMMAAEFVNTGNLDKALGETLSRMLIDDRNAQAMRVLQKELAAGKKRIGIFYGAAHLPDMSERLVSDFGLRPQKIRWLDAWDLSASQAPKSNDPLGAMLNLIQSLDR